MALVGTHTQVQVGTTATNLYTAPTSILVKVTLVLANIDTVQRTVDVTINDNSAASTRHVIKTAPVPVGGSLRIPGIILDDSDVLQALCDSANMIEATVHAVELT